jgi:hypothetical protein
VVTVPANVALGTLGQALGWESIRPTVATVVLPEPGSPHSSRPVRAGRRLYPRDRTAWIVFVLLPPLLPRLFGRVALTT